MRVQVGDLKSVNSKVVLRNLDQYNSKSTNSVIGKNRDKEETSTPIRPAIKQVAPQMSQEPTPEEASIANINIEEQERQMVIKAVLSKEMGNALNSVLKGQNLAPQQPQNSVSPQPNTQNPPKPSYSGTDPLYLRNARYLGATNPNLSSTQAYEMKQFVNNYNTNKARYEAVSAKTDMPPELIAALHWRESSGNFGTYLHQGDPLGRPAVHIPNKIPVFHDWESAAVHALAQKGNIQQKLGITRDSISDSAAMATFSEYYNGKGYFNKNQPSPYVFSGTSTYNSGKYVADGKYDPNAVDKQLGVVSMISSLRNMSQPPTAMAMGPK
jgi:lysozyme family protein